jgi:uncharacterized protein DUF3127
MTAKLTGEITDIFQPEPITANFTKRVFWVKQPSTERYPQHWEIELHNQDVLQIDGYHVGQLVEVEVEVRGKQYTTRNQETKIMTSLKCLGLRRLPPAPQRTKVAAGRTAPPQFRYPETDQ